MPAYKVKYKKTFPGTKMSPVNRVATEQASSASEARTRFHQHHRDEKTIKYEITEVEKA